MGTEEMNSRKKVLFICVGNACRSQMAEALARHLAADVIEASSAGISPLGRIPDATRRVLREKGVSTDGHSSKGISELGTAAPDLIVNMSGIPSKSLFVGRGAVDWDVEDPYGEDLVTYRRICEDIEERVMQLAEELRQKAAAARAKSLE
jgi:arsenate reductase (thioredoxin)